MNIIKQLFLSTAFIAGIACTSSVQATFNTEINTLVHQFTDKKIKAKPFIDHLLNICEKHNLHDLITIVKDVQQQINNLPKFGALLLQLAEKIKPKVDQTAQQKINDIQTKGKENPLSLLPHLY